MYTNFEFTYVKMWMFIAIKPELLKTSALNVISKIINFGCSFLISVCPQVIYVPSTN